MTYLKVSNHCHIFCRCLFLKSNPAQSTHILNEDLLLIENWSFQWKMQFNPDINKQVAGIYFTNKNEVNNILTLTFNNKEVNKEGSHKHFGLFLDEKLTFERQIYNKPSKATKGNGVIKSLYSYLPRNSLLNIYKSFVRPLLDYCDVIYHKSCNETHPNLTYQSITANTNRSFTSKIEAVQYNAALAITGCICGTSSEKLYKELVLMSFHNRKTFHRLIYFYKVKHNLAPNYLRLLIPVTRTSYYNHRSIHFPNMWESVHKFITKSSSLGILKILYLDFLQLNQILYLMFTNLLV